MLVPQKMISATSTALDNYGIVWIPLWSIVSLYNEVSPTGSYILVYSYLYFSASRLKVTRTESTLLDMHINIPRSFDVNVVCSKTRYATIKFDRNDLSGSVTFRVP